MTNQVKTGRQRLLEALGDRSHVHCHLPDGETASLTEALDWIDQLESRGERTAHMLSEGEQGTRVWLKHWPVDGVEPDWPEEWPEPQT